MSETLTKTHKRIKLLAPDVAAKIAAGEVVERPASVLKELLENSIDSGATCIDVEIAQGGIQYISVTDNGCGILKQDLQLALQQHATSKINDAIDLSNINSLGFRGEALASIHSVAKVSITTQSTADDNAWSISGNKIAPAAHPLGTTIKVQDLFYNLPVRRKFLRSPRTEYLYLEELFRRIALSHFEIGFSLTNQGKLVKKLPNCKDFPSQIKRLNALCGAHIVSHAIRIDCEQNGMRLQGWLGAHDFARAQEVHQYFFINQRVVKDRLINHALREVYQPLCIEGRAPFYCLYLELDPVALDVNVHPTKHEVRFRDPRIVHAFITQALTDALLQTGTLEIATGKPTQHNVSFNAPSFANTPPNILGILQHKIIIAQHTDKLLLIDIISAQQSLLRQKIQSGKSQDLPVPFTIACNHAYKMEGEFAQWCEQFGIYFDVLSPHKLVIRKLPQELHAMAFNGPKILEELHNLFTQAIDCDMAWEIIIKSVEFPAINSMRYAQDLIERIDPNNTKICRQFSVQELSTILFAEMK